MDVKRVRLVTAKIVSVLENGKTPFVNYVYLFLGIILTRVFISAFSQEINQFDMPSLLMKESLIHMLTAYACLLMLVGLYIHYTIGQPVNQIMRVFIPLMLVLLFAPVWDIFFAGDEGVSLLYMQPGAGVNVLKTWLTFFGGFNGISAGVRIETGLFLLFGFLYFIDKKCGILYALLLTLGMYTLIFVWSGSPFLVKFILNLTGYLYHYSNDAMIRFFLVVDFVLLAWVSALYHPKLFTMISDHLCIDNLFYYELTLVFGASIAFSLQYSSFSSYMRMYPPVAINELMAMIAILFAYLFATCISSRQTGEGGKDIDTLGYVCLWLSLIYASTISAHAFVVIGALLASFYFYNVMPLQMKRFVIISKLPIGFQSFVALFLGFVIVQHGTYEFPKALAWIYLVGMTLAANVLDLDPMQTGNNTVPALIGERNAKLLTGSILFVVTLTFYTVFNRIWMLPVLGAVGAGFFYLANRRHYDEWKLKLLGNISLALASIYLLSSWG